MEESGACAREMYTLVGLTLFMGLWALINVIWRPQPLERGASRQLLELFRYSEAQA